MIDAVDLLLRKNRADAAIDEVGGRPVVSKGLLEHHARFRGHNAGGGEIVAGEREQARSRREKNNANGVVTTFQGRMQLTEVLRVSHIHPHIVDLRGEGAPARLCELFAAQMLAAGGFDLCEIFLAREIRACHGKHSGRRSHLTCNVAAI